MGLPEIQGALSNLGHEFARSTIADILKRHGIEPAPERSRKTTWKEFLSRHWELIVAADFFTVEVWTRRGLQRFMVLFFIDLSTRRVEIAGLASAANGLWMSQIGRNLTDAVDGILRQALPHPRSGPIVHNRIPEHARRCWHEVRQAPAAIAESECLRGAIRADDQGIVSGAADLVWRRVVAGGAV